MIANRFSLKRISFQLFTGKLPPIPLANACFVPTQKALAGSIAMNKGGGTPGPSSLVSDGHRLYILGHRGIVTVCSLSPTLPADSDRVSTHDLQIPIEERVDMAMTGGQGYLIAVGRFLSRTIVCRMHPFHVFDGPVSVVPDSGLFMGFFGAPKLKSPFASDGRYIYSLESVKRVAVFSIDNPSIIRYHRSIDFQAGSLQLAMPYDNCLVPKEWLT
jgi:hypothetical protein